jgi:hypothetical protein
MLGFTQAHVLQFFLADLPNKERWGALASLFLQNRLNWLNMKTFGEDLPPHHAASPLATAYFIILS